MNYDCYDTLYKLIKGGLHDGITMFDLLLPLSLLFA